MTTRAKPLAERPGLASNSLCPRFLRDSVATISRALRVQPDSINPKEPKLKMTAFTLTQKRIKNVVVGVLAVWAAQIGMASAAVTTAPGLMAGQFDVDSNGAATYAIPIEVPPGKGGVEPHLALK